MPLSIHDARGVYFLSGELDADAAGDFAEAVGSGPEGRGELVIDLSGVDFIDSMGVRMLAQLSHRIGGGLVLRYPQDAVSRVFELLQVDEMPGIRIVRA